MRNTLFILTVATMLCSFHSGNNNSKNDENDSIDVAEQQRQSLKISEKSGELYYRFEIDMLLPNDDDTVLVLYGGKSYSISWPEGDCEELQRALLSASFWNDESDFDIVDDVFDFDSCANTYLNGASSLYFSDTDQYQWFGNKKLTN